jgi:hypothetical protein
LNSGRDVRVQAAFVLARAGSAAEAQNMAEKLSQDFPLDTMIQRYWLPAIRAALELQTHNPMNAIKALEPTLELGANNWGLLAYLRGEGYLMEGQGQGSAAASEFRKSERTCIRLESCSMSCLPVPSLSIRDHGENSRSMKYCGNCARQIHRVPARRSGSSEIRRHQTALC